MKLNESVQEDIIDQFKEVLNAFDAFIKEVSMLNIIVESDNKDLKVSTSYLNDYCRNEVYEKVHEVEEDILDLYYPIDYGDNTDDSIEAGEIYRNSKEARENVFAK